MLKKLLLILVLIAYLSSTIGATVSMHYCMGKLVGTEIGKAKQDKCPKCGMKEGKSNKKKCCSEKEYQVKIKSEHEKAKDGDSRVLDLNYTESNTYFYHCQQKLTQATEKNNFEPQSPPLLLKGRLHDLYCVYLI